MSFLTKEVEEAATILSRAEIFKTSTRNSFFERTKDQTELYNDRKFYNRVYHLVMECIRRQNKLDKYLDTIFGAKKEILNSFQIALFRLLVYIRKEQKYHTKTRPSINHLLKIARSIIIEKDGQNNLNELLKKFSNLDDVTDSTLLTAHDEIDRLSLVYYHPKWLIHMLSQYMEKKSVIKLLKANNKRQTVWIRVIEQGKSSNEIEATIEQLFKEGIEIYQDKDFQDVFEVRRTKKPLILTNLFKKRKIAIQNKSSTAVPHILDPLPNSTVIDLAAAPGMKALQLMEKMKFSGTLILLDISMQRMEKLNLTISSGLSKELFFPDYILCDSQSAPLKNEFADFVLIDAPCSSTGIIGMYPDHKWRPKERVDELVPTQLRMVECGFNLLRKNGIGVYSVCSIDPKEGEFIIAEMLNRHENFILLDPNFGQSAFQVGVEGLELCRRVFPHIDNADGFFYCKFQRK